MAHYAKRSMRVAVSLIGFATLAGCGSMFVAIRVPDSVIASCVRSSGFPDGTRVNVEKAFRSDGLDHRVIRSADISADEAKTINRCIEAAVKGSSALPDVAGVPQRVETVRTGNTVTETYTYGSPPPPATGTKPKAAAAPAVTGSTALPDVAGVPQRVETVRTGNTVTETYTYGSPPPPANGTKPKAAAAASTLAAQTAAYGYCVPGLGVMQRGTSYCIGN
ncbi:MAG: hypothetical protein ACRC14_04090 [Paracoccaceae bacterium]